MKVTVLGYWSPYPRGGEACSGYLVESANTSILLDCGNGVFSKLEQYGSFWNIDAVICTHFHADHSGDLPVIRNAVKSGVLYNKLNDKMPVFLPDEPVEKFSVIEKYQDGLNFRIISEGFNQIKIGDFQIRFFKVEHTISCYGTLISMGDKKIVYFSDTQYFDKLIEYAHEAHLLICEATVLEKNKDYAVGRHLTTKQAGEIAKKANVKRFLPTHFFPEYNMIQVKNEIEETYGKSVVMAEEGLIIEV